MEEILISERVLSTSHKKVDPSKKKISDSINRIILQEFSPLDMEQYLDQDAMLTEQFASSDDESMERTDPDMEKVTLKDYINNDETCVMKKMKLEDSIQNDMKSDLNASSNGVGNKMMRRPNNIH